MSNYIYRPSASGCYRISQNGDELYHFSFGERKNHKYVARVKEGNKYRYFYNQLQYKAYLAGQKVKNSVDAVKTGAEKLKNALGENNIYNVNSANYQQRKSQIQATDEWKNIVNSGNSEYKRTDSEGKTYYDYDEYLTDKKHPVLDALKDYGNGRKVSIQKQNADTFVAGAKDYVEMGRRTAETVGTISVAILTTKIKNQQGSYDDEKAQIKTNVNTAMNAANDALNTYNNVKNSAPTKAQTTIATAAKTANSVANSDKAKQLSSAAVKAYAQANGVDEARARRMLQDASTQVLNYYLRNY